MAKLNTYDLTPVDGAHRVLGINRDVEDPDFNKVISMTVDSIVLYVAGTGLTDMSNAEIRAAVEAATDSNVFNDADHVKLNAIEASADVTDATNVNAAGATMNADIDLSSNGYFLDTDTLSEDSATKVASQQSIKAYVDAQAGGGDTLPIVDTTAVVKGSVDDTKLVRIEADSIATGTTRVITMPNTNVDLGDIATNTAKTTNANHTGDATGDMALTLATVNSNVGSFTAADITVNAKGLITAASSGSGGGTVDVVSNVATDRILGRITAGSGDSEELTATQTRTLLNVEDNADVTDTSNVTSAGALMDSELTDLTGVKGVTISTLQVKPSEGAFVDGDKTKLDTIETNAKDDQTASEVPIVDGGAIITATEVEGALQENRTAINLNTSKVGFLNLTGDVTSSGAVTTISAGAVDLAMLSATGTPSISNFLRGDNTWATPAGSGDMVLADSQEVSGIKTFLNTTMKLRNVADTFDGYFVNTNTVDRIYTLQDSAGTLAFVTRTIVNITGTKSQFDTACTDENFMYIGDAPTTHSHLLAEGATDVTATFGELNLLDLSGLTVNWVLSADSATTASWKAPTGGGGDDVSTFSEKSGALIGSDRLVGNSGGTDFLETIDQIPLSLFIDDLGHVENVTTNLTFSVAPTIVTVISSDGTDAVLPEANTTNAGILGSDKWDEIVANTLKDTNVSTDLSMGTISGTQYTINSSDGNNVNLPLADTNNWGIISDEIFDEIVVNNGKTSNIIQTDLSSISDSKANFNSSVSDGTIIFVDDVIVAPDHGTDSIDQVVNVSYGTSATPPTASTTTEGSLYIQYTA